MKPIIFVVALACGSAALAAPGGPIATLVPGSYVCELPGKASTAAGLRQNEEDFVVLNAGSYLNEAGRGTYLVTGDRVVFTSGPKAGQKFRSVSSNYLRKLDSEAKDTKLRCVRRVINNQ